MIKLQRSTDRRYVRSGSQEIWMSFDQTGFRALDVLNEVKLHPGRNSRFQSDGDQESITYVREGRLVARHRPRGDEYLGPGYCQRATSHSLLITSAPDESPFRGAHLFVSSMIPRQPEGEPSCEQRHYPYSDRRGILRLIASPDGCDASLRLQQDVRVYSSVLDRGRHVVHELGTGRGAWLHVVTGRICLVDQTLETGDGASLDDESAVSFTAEKASEILLFDLA
jgi:redox-sensitive bicupin YhaK (pirin superfamily)